MGGCEGERVMMQLGARIESRRFTERRRGGVSFDGHVCAAWGRPSDMVMDESLYTAATELGPFATGWLTASCEVVLVRRNHGEDILAILQPTVTVH